MPSVTLTPGDLLVLLLASRIFWVTAEQAYLQGLMERTRPALPGNVSPPCLRGAARRGFASFSSTTYSPYAPTFVWPRHHRLLQSFTTIPLPGLRANRIREALLRLIRW